MSELDERAHLYELMDELEVYSFTVRAEMLDDPERAAALLGEAKANPRRLRSPIGWAIARFRAGDDPRARRARARSRAEADYLDEHELELPSLDSLTYLAGVSRASWVGVAMMRLVDVALAKTGGYEEFVEHLSALRADLDAAGRHSAGR